LSVVSSGAAMSLRSLFSVIVRLVSGTGEHRRWATQMFRCQSSGKRGVSFLFCQCMERSPLFWWQVY